MKTVILTKGLPASGKSTWAKSKIDKNPGKYKRVNKDDIRAMLDNSKWSKSNEKFVLSVRDSIIISALSDGKHVIVDDTNLHPKHESQIRELVKGIAKVEIKDFTEITPETCIKWDLTRLNSVGSEVIRNMYNQFLKPEPVVYNPDENLPKAIICDIDGTIALMNNRSPFDWKKVGEDTVNKPVLSVLNGAYYLSTQRGPVYIDDVVTGPLWVDSDAPLDYPINIILLSGRDSICKKETTKWIEDNNIPCTALFMRSVGDIRKDTIVKKELFDNHIKDNYNVQFVLDDRDCVVNMWRDELGLTVLQVAEGDF